MNTMSAVAAPARDLPDLSLTEAAAMLAAGRVTPLDLTEAVLARIEDLDGRLFAYVTVTRDHALTAARTATEERAAGLNRGPLHGIPLAVKDLCETDFAPTSGGMALHRAAATGRNATVVDRLQQAGAVILGKLAMTEGAYSGHHPDMPVPKNPWNEQFWAGSSSSGSGVAVAAGLAYGTLGSDTGGSIRFPSNANGITGLKPTWGRVSRHGVMALADSLDHVGPMARSAADCAAMLTVLAGADPLDPTTLTAPVPDYLAGLATPIRGLRIGVDRANVLDIVSSETAQMLADALAVLGALGAEIVPVTLPFPDDAVAQWTALCGIEVALAHKATYPARRDEYGPYLDGIIAHGHTLSAIELGEAMQWRLVYNGAMARAMAGVDMVILPVQTAPLPLLDNALGAPSASDEADLGDLLKFTAPADFTGYPALTLPGGFDRRGAPMGFQLMGPALSEPALLRAGHAFQSVTDWHLRRPDLSGGRA